MAVSIDELELYRGDDLDRAAELSRIAANEAAFPSTSGLRLVDDLRNLRWRELVPRHRLVTGRERSSRESLNVVFSGTLRPMKYLSDAIFGEGEWAPVAAPGARGHRVDIVVSDHPFRLDKAGRFPEIRMPTWVRQQIDLDPEWTRTLDAIPRAQPNRLRRFLRRFNYKVTCSRGPDALADLYEHILVPSATRRFGEAAVLPKKSAFLVENRHSVRLDLTAGDALVAVNLVHINDRKLSIRKGALVEGYPELKGRMDVLDYFTLLVAQLLECEVLDFGLSRPYLDDGSLRYKAKWGAKLVPAGGLKSDVRIVSQRLSAPVLSLLRRNRFIGLSGGRFITKVVWDEDSSAEDLDVTMTLARSSGLDGLEILVANGSNPPVIESDRGITVECGAVSLAR